MEWCQQDLFYCEHLWVWSKTLWYSVQQLHFAWSSDVEFGNVHSEWGWQFWIL